MGQSNKIEMSPSLIEQRIETCKLVWLDAIAGVPFEVWIIFHEFSEAFDGIELKIKCTRLN